MRKSMNRKFTALILATSMVLTACNSGGQSSTSAAGDSGQTKAAETTAAGAETAGTEAVGKDAAKTDDKEVGRDTIVAAVSSDIKSMDPASGVDSPSATLNKHIYNGLVKIDQENQV